MSPAYVGAHNLILEPLEQAIWRHRVVIEFAIG